LREVSRFPAHFVFVGAVVSATNLQVRR